jgi:hypothetical protein
LKTEEKRLHEQQKLKLRNDINNVGKGTDKEKKMIPEKVGGKDENIF